MFPEEDDDEEDEEEGDVEREDLGEQVNGGAVGLSERSLRADDLSICLIARCLCFEG